MLMKTKLSLICCAIIASTTALQAMQFQTVGYQSISMGGAGVASSSGSAATYNNPALLAKAKYSTEIALSAGASTHDHGAGASMQSLDDTGFLDTLDKASNNVSTITQADVDNLYAGKDVIIAMDGKSIELSPQAYFAAQIGGFGLGVFGTSDSIAVANVSQAHDQLIFDDTANSGTYQLLNSDNTLTASNLATYQSSSMEYALNNGLTNTELTAIGIAEVPIAYGYKFELSGGNIYLGGALKYMQAKAYTETMKVDNTGSSSSSDKQENSSTDFGVDVGLAYEPSFASDLTIAFVAKNLNTPKFQLTDTQKLEIEPMFRAGLSYAILESLEVAMDVDISKNKTLSDVSDSQMFGGGLNYAPLSWFSLRAGAMQNLDSNDNAGMIYTAGLGFGFKWFQVDLSGQMSGKSETVNGTSYPQYAKANVALISRW
jgi:hypothetical protein